MQVTWDPEDGTPKRVFQFDEGDILRSDAEQIEKHYGSEWEHFINGLRIKNAKARAVLLWYCLKTEMKEQGHSIKLRFEDTPDFRMRQLTVEMNSDELRALYAQISRSKMNDDTRDAFEAAYQRDLQDAMIREGKAAEGDLIDLAGQLVPVPKAD
jgi:hypothetical protein